MTRLGGWSLTALALAVLLQSAGPESASANAAPGSPASQFLPELRTPGEASGFERHTLHPEMVGYLHEVRARSVDMSLGVYGQTHQGRDLYYALYSRPAVHSPAEAHASGKPIIVLGANVHGHNYTLRESLLIMMRDLGQRGTDLNGMLDEVVVIVVPSKNPDGLAAESRFNAVGADLNRDYIALEHPAMAAYIGKLINHWHPHLFVDGHNGGAVQYGGAYPYHLFYQAAGTAGADPAITALADHRIFPLIDRTFEAAGYRSFYWARGDEERWYGGGAAPRMGRNYGGLANKVSIVFESADWPDTETSVRSGILAYRTIIEFARDHGDELIGSIREAQRRTIDLGANAEGEVPVAETMEADDFLVTYQIRPADGGDLIAVRNAPIMKKPVGTAFRDRPWAYVLPADAVEAVSLLRRHNIAVEKLTAGVELDAQVYTLAGVRFESGDNNHAAAVRVEVGDVRRERIEIPAGAHVVRTGQTLGRVVTQLLEPENSDNIVYWNRMTFLLPIAEMEAHRGDAADTPAPLIPIYKLMEPHALPAVLVK